MKIITLLVIMLCLVCVFSMPAKAAESVLYVYNWSDYMPQEVLDKFTKETGIRVIYSTYESNEAMYDMVSVTSGNGYDIVVPSGYFVSMMVEDGMLRKLDKGKLSNYKYLDKNRLGSNPDYAIPYCWGSTLMLVNSNYIDSATITSWNDLLKPEFAGKIVMYDDLRDVFSVALYALGYSINTHNIDEIKEAYEWLRRLKPRLQDVKFDTLQSAFENGDAVVGLIYNGIALQLSATVPGLEAIYPKEGVSLWIDCLAIPKGSKNVDNAYKFIDFLLRPEINKMVVEKYYYSTPNVKTFDLLDKELKENNVINPTQQDLGLSVFTDYVGDALPIYEKYWAKLKAGLD